MNQNAPGAVTAVPREAFASGRPVAAVAVKVTPQQIQHPQVVQRTVVAPPRNLVPMASKTTSARPPAALANRTIVTKMKPSPQVVPIGQRTAIARSNVVKAAPPAAAVKKLPPPNPANRPAAGAPGRPVPGAARPATPATNKPFTPPPSKAATTPNRPFNAPPKATEPRPNTPANRPYTPPATKEATPPPNRPFNPPPKAAEPRPNTPQNRPATPPPNKAATPPPKKAETPPPSKPAKEQKKTKEPEHQ